MHRLWFALLAATLISCDRTAPDPESPTDPSTRAAGIFDGSAGAWVDLTHPFSDRTIYWPTDTLGFRLDEQAYGPTAGGWFYASYSFSSAEHGGTHLDAPIHFAEGRRAADEIPLSDLMGPAAVVDVSGRVNADYQVSIDDLASWEARHGLLPAGGILLLRTGWGSRWDDRADYLGTALTGAEAVANLHFPGLAPDAAEWLARERQIIAVGIDTPSIDYGQSADFGAHVALYSRDIAGFENVANLEALPEAGAFVIALPMKIEGGSGGPLRIVAFVPR